MWTEKRRKKYNDWCRRKPESWHVRKRRMARLAFERRLAVSYGFTLEEWRAKKKAERHCGICGIKFSDRVAFRRKKRPNTRHTDHDHSTGKFRGFVCGSCNLLLGFAKESSEILMNAIEYLKTCKGERHGIHTQRRGVPSQAGGTRRTEA